jgi:hypothetical protein
MAGSKNTSPFLVQTWDATGWTDGWTQAVPYAVAGGRFLFLLKAHGGGDDDRNVHIHPFLEDSGELASKQFTRSWTAGWTTAAFFESDAGPRLFLLKASGAGSDGRNVHVNEFKENGDIGGQLFGHTWASGWTLARFFRVGGRPFLFLLRATGYDPNGHNVLVHEVRPNGDFVPSPAYAARWTQGWTSAEFYEVGGRTILFLLKANGTGEDGHNVHLNVMNADGMVGERLESFAFSEGWTTVRAFRAAGHRYLTLLKASKGVVQIHNIKGDGTLGSRVCSADRKSYSEDYSTGSLAPWGPVPWTSGWTTLEPIETPSGTFLFSLKEVLTGTQEKRAKIYRVRPMESVGPMVGPVGARDAAIWVGSVGGTPVSAIVEATANGATTQSAVQFTPPAERNNGDDYYDGGVAHLTGLEPGTQYAYRVLFDGIPFGSGTFRTQPATLEPFTVALASCMDLHHDRIQATWAPLLAGKPNVLLLAGDNAYPNTTLRSMIWAEHLQQRGVASFAEVIRQTSTLCTWDDHDFGPNNSSGADKETAYRGESQATFRELHKGFPFAATQGIYYVVRWQNVEIYMLDVRYFRHYYASKDVAPRDRRMLGSAQWSWLEKALAASTAKFKLLVSGTTVDAAKSETWEISYPTEWSRLQTLATRTPGLLLLTGDVHFCQIRHHLLTTGRTLWEIVSSGIAKNETTGKHEHGYVTLGFDTTKPGQESVVVRVFRKDGSERTAERVTIALASIS